jgi:prolyl-tRNA synthetase
MLEDIQRNLYLRAKEFLDKHTFDAKSYEELKEYIGGGFVRAYWCGSIECELKVKAEVGADIRVIPFQDGNTSNSNSNNNRCIYCNKEAYKLVYFAKAY